MKDAVLLTGISGFIGSHIAKHLVNNGYKVIALVRPKSDQWRYQEIIRSITTIDLTRAEWRDEVKEHKPTCLIHSAWIGVGAAARNDWNEQIKNIDFAYSLLSLSEALGLKKFISFGSQAEYGAFHGRINETFEAAPQTAYGAVKMAVLQMLKTYCSQHNIDWYWLRLFSIYGTNEDKTWLLTSVINNLLDSKEMSLTKCEQRYDYLYIDDLLKAVQKVAESKGNDSGVYNLSSDRSVMLYDLIEKIRQAVNPAVKFNYGALPYREGQVMHMEGDSTKFNKAFDFKVTSSMDENLRIVIDHIKTNKN